MSKKPPLTVPLLENGDRLSRHEFERRYDAMPELKKAELIEGVVYVPAAVRIVNHGRPHAQIMGWLLAYQAVTPGVDIGDNATVRLDRDNEPQPDGLLRIAPEVGGNSRISDDGYVEGAPELIVEIAASSVSIDMNAKLNVYRRNGVQEYLVWRVNDDELDWFTLQNDQYVALEPNAEGIVQSQVFPGLWLAVEALLEGDLANVLAELQRGTAAAEHQAFVERLRG
ncbi:MAG: Uma2 family endonuclease [Leptolyngbyaceae cyanobacterium SL_7_1]|nr:Uma2 family endonuclease [Leptolyngbyaceae cyanobacterium SL_7_1]